MAATEKKPDQIALARNFKHVPWCEEYEKMISGMLYNSFEEPLATARFNARKACHEYNTTFPSTPELLASDRLQRLQSFIGHIADENAYIEPPFHVDYGSNISIGKRFYASFNLTILDCALVHIGNRCMIGPNVSIFAATHETEVSSRRQDIEYALPVTIGNDCWIGGHAVILPGVTIGEGCTIAAASVVTKDIPAWSVARGSPAKVVKTVTKLEPEEGD